MVHYHKRASIIDKDFDKEIIDSLNQGWEIFFFSAESHAMITDSLTQGQETFFSAEGHLDNYKTILRP